MLIIIVKYQKIIKIFNAKAKKEIKPQNSKKTHIYENVISFSYLFLKVVDNSKVQKFFEFILLILDNNIIII